MSKAKAKQRAEPQQDPPTLSDEEMEDSDAEIVSEPESFNEADESEQELAKLVFGDKAGFRQGLKDLEGDANDDKFTALQTLEDADLFFVDTTGTADQQISRTGKESEDDDTLPSRQPAAWEDSDDERMAVSLAAVPRLRKLRLTEAEDVVNGKEYARRLRKQYELLSPRPEWARHAMQQPPRKRLRLSDDEASDHGDDSMDESGETPSAEPLSKLLAGAEGLIRQNGRGSGKKRKIRPEVIDIQRTKDIDGVQPSAITSLSFHPQLPLLLSSGPSSTLYLHQIAPSPPAPSPNPLLTSLHVRGSALTTTAFHPTDSRIFLSARRRYFHVWNLESGRVEKIARVYGQQHEQRSMERFELSPDGKYMALLGSAKKGGGVINIVSAATLQWVSQSRIESRGGIADFAWWRNSQGLCIAGKSGEVSEWSLSSEAIVARWQDEGAVGTTTIALGGQHELVKCPVGTDRWVAIGSSSGIVNIYDRRVWATSGKSTPVVPTHPKPTRVLDHLTTPTSSLTFSQDGQILAMSSKWKRDALRLVHLPSCTVFKNWPTSSTPLGRITAVAFCGGEKVEGDLHSLLAVANEQGKIRLWEIR